ncbi:MAG: RdgB/HAM1 family non-canonical purine NTP pyrophosphatase [Thermoplasmatota archaeon]
MRLAMVTGNKGKLAEAQAHFSPLGIDVFAADVAPIEIQSDSLLEVARAKAEDAARRGVEPPFFLDDAGLFVDALRGFPGVYSAHALKTLGTAGLLKLMDGVADRRARFECALAFHDGAVILTFAGRCDGQIALAERSRGEGFGFDPVFVPDGYGETFAELALTTKNQISHRGRALAAFSSALVGRR